MGETEEMRCRKGRRLDAEGGEVISEAMVRILDFILKTRVKV